MGESQSCRIQRWSSMKHSAAQWKVSIIMQKEIRRKKQPRTASDVMILTIDFAPTRSNRKAFKDFGTLHTIAHGERQGR